MDRIRTFCGLNMQAERFDMQEGGGEKILVIGPSWVGDMVMAQSLFMVLRKYNTDCRIIVVAPDWSLPLIDRMPEIEGHLEYGFKHGELNLARRMSVGKSIQAQNFSKTIVLPISRQNSRANWLSGRISSFIAHGLSKVGCGSISLNGATVRCIRSSTVRLTSG